MSLLPNQSYANPDTPLWAPASIVTAFQSTELVPVPISSGMPIDPAPPFTYILPAYPTKAGGIYDINILMAVDVVSGVSSGGDQLRLFVSVDPPPFGTSTGEWANDYRIGATPRTYVSLYLQLKCTADSVFSLSQLAWQIGGSTATYSSGLISVLISEVPS